MTEIELCAQLIVSVAERRSILVVVGGGLPSVPKIGGGVIDFYAQVFQPKLLSYSHTLTL